VRASGLVPAVRRAPPLAGRSAPPRHPGLLLAVVLALSGCGDQVTTPTGSEVLPGLTRTRVVASGAQPNAVLHWNQTALDAVSAGTLGPPMVARALALVHTAIYDAWAAYHPVALGTQAGGAWRRPLVEHTEENKVEAISYAAYRALVDLFPAQQSRFESQLLALGYDPSDASEDLSTAVGIGNSAGLALMAARHHDGSNQLGTLGPTGLPYSDYTGYVPVNTPDEVSDPNAWQPLRHPNRAGTAMVTPGFLGAHWNRVTPFALHTADELRPPPPRYFSHGLYRQQAEELIRLSAGLTDREKVIAEYWADGPSTVLPPGHFNLFAQWVSLRDGHTLDEDVKLFFILTNAVFDAGIASWDAKIHYDYVRPITAIRYLKQGQKIRAWAGPGLGTRVIRGEDWRPYQPDWFPTPPFSEYVSGHSTFSAAAAEILRRFTGSDAFGASVTITAGDLGVEPGVPAQPVTLAWPTFTAAADEAGISRRYGGIHFRDGDLEGRRMGRLVAARVWDRAMEFLTGQGGS
jgi:hypothetical protein